MKLKVIITEDDIKEAGKDFAHDKDTLIALKKFLKYVNAPYEPGIWEVEIDLWAYQGRLKFTKVSDK